MVNHQHPANVTCGYDMRQEGFVIQALEDIGKGHEIYVSYSELNPKIDLFLNYGIVDPDPDTH
jgi:hypothetical protein